MKIGAIADLHLGQGAERYGPQRLADQADVWSRAIDLFVEEGCDAVLFGGDAFERRRYPSQAELVAFDTPLRRLQAAGIPIVGISGNHDRLDSDGPTSLDLFDDVMLVAATPKIFTVAGVAVACLPWTPISRLVAHRNGGDRDSLYAEAAALLHATSRGLRAEITDRPAILLAHWSVSGAVTPTGRDVGPDFGVVLDAAELEAQGWDAIVLGHIHRQQFVTATGFYTGSPLPLNFGEADGIHSVTILDLDPAAAEFARVVPIKSRRFETVEWFYDEAEPFTAAARVQGAIVRVRYTATEEDARRINPGAIRERLLAEGAAHVTVEPEILRADRARVHIETDTLTELEALNLYLEANGVNGTRGSEMAERTQRYLEARS